MPTEKMCRPLIRTKSIQEKILNEFAKWKTMKQWPRLLMIRANTIIAAGDLNCRFPNTLEPWTPRMYACLRDDSPQVRSNTLTVLTHLILNDMIKVSRPCWFQADSCVFLADLFFNIVRYTRKTITFWKIEFQGNLLALSKHGLLVKVHCIFDISNIVVFKLQSKS